MLADLKFLRIFNDIFVLSKTKGISIAVLRNFELILGNSNRDPVFEPRTATGNCRNFSVFGEFSRHRFCNVKPKSSATVSPVRSKEQNHAKKGNIQLPVAVRGSRTSVLNSLLKET